MLIIQTDLKDQNWLLYILEEFKKSNCALFEIEVLDVSKKPKSLTVIQYVETPSNSICFFNSNQKRPDGKVEHLSDTLFVGSSTQSSGFSCNYDLLWNAFVFLSRYEEKLFEEGGGNIHSYSPNHPREDKETFSIPIVNILFNEFEKIIRENFPSLSFGEKVEPTIDLSHDVDYINKTLQLRLKQTAFNGFNTIKSLSSPKLFWKNLKKTFLFLFSSPSYWCFDYWQTFEKSLGKRSIFYIYTQTKKKGFKTWLLDPSYNITNNKKLQNKLIELKNDGFEIGLHGSYESATDFNLLKAEKETLEKALGLQVSKTRQHWLNYFEDSTPHFHEKLFKEDSTLAWNDRIGFRSGIANKYRPYNFKNEKAFNYEIVPQIIMDSNVYDYANDDKTLEKAKDILALSMQVSKICYVSISWHQRVSSSDYNWHVFYEELLDSIK